MRHLSALLAKSEKACFVRMSGFVGFTCCSSMGESANNLLKHFIRREKSYANALLLLDKFTEHCLKSAKTVQVAI